MNIWGNPSQGLPDPLFVWILYPPAVCPALCLPNRGLKFCVRVNFQKWVKRYNHFLEPNLHSLQLVPPLSSHNLTTVSLWGHFVDTRQDKCISHINAEWEWKILCTRVRTRWSLVIDFPCSFGGGMVSHYSILNKLYKTSFCDLKAGGTTFWLSYIFIICPLMLQRPSNSLCLSQVCTPVCLIMHS